MHMNRPLSTAQPEGNALLEEELRGRCASLLSSEWRGVRAVGHGALWGLPRSLKWSADALLHTLPARALFLLGFSPIHTLLLTASLYTGGGYELWRRKPSLFLHVVACAAPLVKQGGWEAYWGLYAVVRAIGLLARDSLGPRGRRWGYWSAIAVLLWGQSRRDKPKETSTSPLLSSISWILGQVAPIPRDQLDDVTSSDDRSGPEQFDEQVLFASDPYPSPWASGEGVIASVETITIRTAEVPSSSPTSPHTPHIDPPEGWQQEVIPPYPLPSLPQTPLHDQDAGWSSETTTH